MGPVDAVRRAWVLALSVACASGCGRVGFRVLDASLDAAPGPDDAAGDLDAGTDASAPAADTGAPGSDAGTDADADAAPLPDDAATHDAPSCSTVFDDDDGDGWGADATMRLVCGTPPATTVPRAGDCDDGSALVSPEGDEACNGFDDDCDRAVDEGSCDGSVVRVVVSALLRDESERRLDVDPRGRLLVLGTDGSGEASVEVRTPQGALSSTHAAGAGSSRGRWIRGLRSGWVLGAPTELRRFDGGGGSMWSRTFPGGGAGWDHYDAAANDEQIVIAGSQTGEVDVGTGPLPFDGLLTSLVASYDPTTGAPRWVRRHEGGETTSVDVAPGATYFSGYFGLAPVDLDDGVAVLRPIFVGAIDAGGRLIAEWRAMRPASLDDAVLGLVRLDDGDVIFVADWVGGDFEGMTFPSTRGALIARFTWTTGAVRWARAFPVGTYTNQVVDVDAGGGLACFNFALRSGPTDWGGGVTTSTAGPTVLCVDASTGASRFAFSSAGSREVAVGPTGLVYTAGPAGLGIPIEITIRR